MRRAFLLLAAVATALAAYGLLPATVHPRSLPPGAQIAEHEEYTIQCGSFRLRAYDSLDGRASVAIIRTAQTARDLTELDSDNAEWIFLGPRFVDAEHLIAFTRALDGAVTPWVSTDCGGRWTRGRTIAPHAGRLELTVDGTELLISSFEWNSVYDPPQNLAQRLWIEPRPHHSVSGTRLFTSHDFGRSWTSEFPSRFSSRGNNE